MNRMFVTAAIAAVALTATAVDARPSARQRGNASGQESRERAATKQLNAQQLAGGSAGMAGTASMAGGSGMAGDTAASSAGGSSTTGMGSTTTGMGTMGTASGSDSTMPQASGAPEAMPAPMADTNTAMPGTTSGMSNGSADMAGMDHGAMMQKDGKWMMGDRPATKAEIASHKKMMKDQKPM